MCHNKVDESYININFRNQPIPILSQHEPYVYLGINLVPSLQWKTQTHVTTTKLIKQCKLLTTCLATMKQKIQMVDTVIKAGIAYSFYAVPHSLPAIKKLDKRIIALHKNICGLPKCLSNAIMQLPQNMFGTEAFSLKNAYITCIGEQLINALNVQGRLGRIYNGLTKYILANTADHSTYQEYPHMIARGHQLQEHYTSSKKLVPPTLEVHLRNSPYTPHH